MSISTSVRLPEDLHSRLRTVAKARGTTVSRLVVETMGRQFPPALPRDTRADVALADIIGCVASSGRHSARDAERELGEILEDKRRESRL